MINSRFTIVEDYEAVKRARVQSWVAYFFGLAGAIVAVISVIEALRRSEPAFGAVAICGAMFVGNAVLASRDVGWLRTLETDQAEAYVSTVGDRIRVRHPVLLEDVEIPLQGLRAFDIVAKTVKPRSRFGHRRYELFAVSRLPGTTHPLNEPFFFLAPGDEERLGKPPVALASIDLGLGLPNAAILFDSYQEVGMFVPKKASEFGWVPPVRPIFAFARAATAALVREKRRFRTPGFYLNVESPLSFAASLRASGVRQGFTCADWMFATRHTHPMVSRDGN